ncbi:hypothetical protein PCK2_000122 [Pneumocystis canis]|nr:hypothetical protein PCK2_000122 [Pneumocystis canis]
MIIPVRCFSCGKVGVIGDKWDTYLLYLQEDISEGEALDNLGLKRYCCRRMILTHVDLIEKLLHYNRRFNINLIGVVTILPVSDYYRSRMYVFILCCIIIIIGMLTLTFSSNKWVQYSGLLITMYGTGPTIPICIAWCAQIFGSETKVNAAASSAMLSGLGNLGSIFTTSVLYEGMSGKNAYKKSNLILCGIIGVSIIASLFEKVLLRYYSKKTKPDIIASERKTDKTLNSL